ncbi:MAG: hypothetical protein AB1295_03040 [Candidatus Micrarchaeota archaeon]
MEFDELLITTGVDALVRLVKEKERVELEDASSILNIPQESIEDWARVLEEEGILRLEYRLTRIFLVWIRPTEEEVVQERQSFYEEKKGLEQEITEVKERVASGTAEMEDLKKSFSKFYDKVYGRIDALEKMVAPVPAAKTISDDLLAKSRDEIAAMGEQLKEAREGLREVKEEMEGLKVKKGAETSEKLMDKIDEMGKELGGLQNELAAIQKRSVASAPKDMEMPSVRDIKKKFETLQKDFNQIKSQNARMREDMVSLHESSDILREVAESIMGHEDRVGDMRAEMEGLVKEAEALAKKSEAVVSRIRESAELAERLSDSVEVSKSLLKKFPSQEKVMEKMAALESAEKELEEKTAALEKLLQVVGGKKVASKQFDEIAKKMETKARQMRREMDSLEAALDDEKETYLTFQKIKERIVPSIERYQTQLDAMEAKLKGLKDESASRIKEMKEEAEKLQQSIKGGEVQDAIKLAEEIRGKKKMLDDIRSSLDEMGDIADNLNKRITLLSREAKLLEIRTGGGAAVKKAEEEGVREKLSLTEEEELEFRKKREELKRLIQKLWEQ